MADIGSGTARAALSFGENSSFADVADVGAVLLLLLLVFDAAADALLTVAAAVLLVTIIIIHASAVVALCMKGRNTHTHAHILNKNQSFDIPEH